MVTRIPVSFPCGGLQLQGHLLLPRHSEDDPGDRLPAVVLAHGFGQVMELFQPHAEHFARAGFAALTFDYRNFGESQGQPRQVVDLAGQRDDVRSALAFMRAHPEVDPDRVALWGNSLGGGHVVVVAAGDPRVAAVVSQIPFNGFPRRVEDRSAWQTGRLLLAMVSDAVRRRLGLPPRYIRLVGRPGEIAVTTTEQARHRVESVAGSAPTWRNEVGPAALLDMMRYRPSDHAAALTMPLLVSAAEHDRESPLETVRLLADRAPRGQLRVYPGGHLDFYEDLQLRTQVLDEQVDFLRTVLLQPAAP